MTRYDFMLSVEEATVTELVPAGIEQVIKIETDESTGEALVSGRELHERLEVKTEYRHWIKRMLDYGFVENTDYIAIGQKRPTAQGNETTYTDHILKLDTAKEIAMIQRNEAGKKIRRYLIEVEKAWNSPEKIMQRALLIAQKNINRLELENKEMRPKAIFADAVSTSEQSILIGELAKLLRQNGINTGQNRLFEWMRDSGYLIKRKGEDYNMPTQKSMELGIMEIKETTGVNPDGSIRINKTTKITGKGQTYFVNKFLNPEMIGKVDE